MQQAEPLERALEGLHRALEARAERGGQPQLLLHLLHLGHRVAERHPGLEVEGDGHRGELAQVIDGERAHRARELGHRVERDELAARAADVEHAEGGGIVAGTRAGAPSSPSTGWSACRSSRPGASRRHC